jgi:hypothetical protein
VAPGEFGTIPPGNPITRGPGQAGAYHFVVVPGTPSTTLNLLCAGQDTRTGATAAGEVQVDTQGWFINYLCGTGRAGSAVGQSFVAGNTQRAGDPGLWADLLAAVPGVSYGIVFAGGQGVFSWGPGSSIYSLPENTTGQYTGVGLDGAVTISASFDNQTPGSGTGSAVVDDVTSLGAANECTDHLSVTGTITGQFNGNN